MRPRTRRRLGRAGLVLAGLALGLVLAEALARRWPGSGVEGLVYGAPEGVPPEAYVGDPELFQVPRPGWTGVVQGVEYEVSLRFDARGLRGDGGEPGTLLLGDSLTLAAQVEEPETLAGQLAALLGEGVGNAGVDGYSTWQATGRYRRLGDLDPSRVVLLFFLGNDLADNERFPMIRGQVYTPRPRETAAFGGRSALLAFARVWWRARALRSEAAPERERFRRELAVFSREGASVLQAQLPSTEAALRELRDEATARGDALLVALAPPSFVLDRTRAAATFELVGLDPAEMDLEAPVRAVKEVLARLGVSACDLLPALREAEHPYFTFDGHWTAAGNAAAAAAVAGCVQDGTGTAGRSTSGN